MYNSVPGEARLVGYISMESSGRIHNPYTLLTIIWILPSPNSAALFTKSSICFASNISPTTARAFPPVSLMLFATSLAFSVEPKNKHMNLHQHFGQYCRCFGKTWDEEGEKGCGEEAILESISCTITFAPSNANSLAVSAPMPCPDPVMIAT